MSHILDMILPLIAAPIGSAIAAGLSTLVAYLLAKLAAKTKDTHKLELLSAVQDAAETAILHVEQTYVKEMKKSGDWDKPSSHATALALALSDVKVMAASVLPTLAKMGVEIGDEYLRTLLEAALRKITAKG